MQRTLSAANLNGVGQFSCHQTSVIPRGGQIWGFQGVTTQNVLNGASQAAPQRSHSVGTVQALPLQGALLLWCLGLPQISVTWEPQSSGRHGVLHKPTSFPRLPRAPAMPLVRRRMGSLWGLVGGPVPGVSGLGHCLQRVLAGRLLPTRSPIPPNPK